MPTAHPATAVLAQPGCSRPTALGELRAATAGLCATLVGIGLARFAYTPLLPALIEGGWFSPPDAAYLAAANLVGYLAGAIGARPVMGRMRPTNLVRAIHKRMRIVSNLTTCQSPWPLQLGP